MEYLSLFTDFAKNSLIESLFCCEKAIHGIKTESVFAPCWQKCASFFLAKGILALNHFKPSPTHNLDSIRNLEKNPTNEKISIINETLGIERATPSLLERMLKSTIGFSELVDSNNTSLQIRQKYRHFLENSMFSDCYFYLGFITYENFLKLKDTIEKKPDLIYLLKVAFDLQADLNLVKQQTFMVKQASNEILEIITN